MWTGLFLRRRILLLLTTLLLTIFVVSLIIFRFAADEDFDSELVPFQQQASETTSALNAALAAAKEPHVILRAFTYAQNNQPEPYLRFEREPNTQPHMSKSRAPNWFLKVFGFSNVRKMASRPVVINGTVVGYLIFSSDDAADIDEKWDAFLGLLIISVVGGVGSLFIAYGVLGSILHPLNTVSTALKSIEQGIPYSSLDLAGPPDFFPIMNSANELASALTGLRKQNEQLLNALVSAQDQERDEIARDLHDELGPILFALRAHTLVLEQRPDIGEYATYKIRDLGIFISSLQLAYRQILDRLRPTLIEDVGLTRSISVLIESVRHQNNKLSIKAFVDPRVEGVRPAVGRTIYRLIQESLLNVQKHTKASDVAINVSVFGDPSKVIVEVRDNGQGFPVPLTHGRGLRGMNERVQALGGVLQRENRQGAFTRCELPFA